MKRIRAKLRSTKPFIGPLLLVLTSIIAWAIAHFNGYTLSYNDSMSHINIARLVIDNQQPGFAQLGSVWLPLNHILPLPFIWNDWAWRTGLAAIVFSMISYVVSSLAIYKTVLILTKNKVASFIGALAFATNLNILYLQSTPLTEPLYVALFTLSVLTFTLWLTKKDNSKYLLLLGALGFLQVITRYDGWFVVFAQGLFIAIHELTGTKKQKRDVFGKLFMYGLPVTFGISLWLLWNGIIFGDPFFFAYGPYSAHTQQELIEEAAGLLAKNNIFLSSLAYGYAMLHNIGAYVLTLSLIGISVFFATLKKSLSLKKKAIFLGVLASPILFNIISLFLGFSVINVPELHWNASDNIANQWFNVRYGILALPFAAVLLALFANWKKVAVFVALVIIVLQAFVMQRDGISTLIDGTQGASSFQNYGVSVKLRLLVQPEDTVLMSLSYFNPVAFQSNLDLKQIIHEGVSTKWNEALENPNEYADLVVVGGEANSGEPLRKIFINSQKYDLLTHYELVHTDSQSSVYKLKQQPIVSTSAVAVQ